MSIRSRRLDTNPALAISELGQGEAVLFLHGLGSTKENWSYQLQAIGAHHYAIAWDARGYGGSDDLDMPRDFARDFAGDLRQVLDRLGIERAHLVGLSMGGIIAQCFYFLHPDRVATLTLADTFARFADIGAAAVAGFRAARIQPLLEGAQPADLASSAADALLGSGAPAEVRERLIGTLSALRPASYLKTVEAMIAQDALGALEDVNVPVLVIAGESDRLSPVSMAEQMARRLPNSTLAIIAGAGHMTNMERPVAFNDVLIRFLAAHAGRASRGPR